MENFKPLLANKIYKIANPDGYKKVKFRDLPESKKNVYESISQSFIDCFDEETEGIYADVIYKIGVDLNNAFKSQYDFMSYLTYETFDFYKQIVSTGIKTLRQKKADSPEIFDDKVDGKFSKQLEEQYFKSKKNTKKHFISIFDNKVEEKIEDEFFNKHARKDLKQKDDELGF